ncbi:MAG: hypothetical protein IKB93_00925 [Clostridia bacterium]|nr:hypothetical protein [Clostridia bacterium]
MKFNFSTKRIVCFLLAIAMVLSVVACKETKKKKKKVIVEEVVIVKPSPDDDEHNTSSDNDNSNDDNDISDDFEYPDYSTGTTPSRRIPTLKLEKEKYVEPVIPEFESKNVDWEGPVGYTVVYDAEKSANRVLANKLATYFKDTENIILEVKSDADPTLQSAEKLILVGDTFYKKSSLKKTEFAVTLLDSGNLFFEGGHDTMVEKAVDWFRTVEREEGKVAVLTGEQDDFVTEVNLFGKDYVYVWGDEFDGEEFMDTSKWGQRGRTEYSDLKIVFNDPHFQYVENGRLRISVDRYFDPVDGDVGWGAHGSCNSYGDMIFKNGYLEMKVRFDYGQGSFPALWLMTNDSPLEMFVPNYEQYKGRYFDLETDIFEFFGKGTHAAANMHKWYSSKEQIAILDEEGNPTNQYRVFGVNGVDLTDSYKFLRNTHSSKGFYTSFSWNWPGNVSTFNFDDDEAETLYKDYHLYQMLYDADAGYVKFGIDNNWYCTWPLDVAFDYIDGVDPTNNNNGIGFNFWHYVFLDQYVYPPSRVEEKGADAVITIESAPLDSYVDYVRLYQLPDDIAIITSHGVEE